MDNITFALNTKKPGNYAFFCPVSKLHLTISNPVGHADRITSSIINAIKTGVIVDVNNVVDTETGEVKKGSKKSANTEAETVEAAAPLKEPLKAEEKVEIKDSSDIKPEKIKPEESKEEKPKTKGRKKKEETE